MTLPERLDADFRGTGLTIGRHPVAHHRRELNKLGVLSAIDAREMRDGSLISRGGVGNRSPTPGHSQGICFFKSGR